LATNYPGSLDTSSEQPSPLASTEMDDAGFEHDVVHTNHSGAIIALETKVGTGSSTAVADSVLAGTGAGTSSWSTSPTLSGLEVDGNLGVGTSSPVDPLHVVGDVTIEFSDDGSAAQPEVTLQRNSTTPADGDYLGQFKFAGKNDAGQTVNYAKITGKISDVTDTTEDGLIEIANISGGSQSIGYRFTSTDLKLINGRGLEVAGDVAVDTDTLFVDTTNDRVGIGTTTPDQTLDVDGALAVRSKMVTGQSTFTQEPWAASTIAFGGYGSLGTQGSYRASLAWNYERGTDSGWHSLGINSYTSAAGIDLGNDGILFRTDATYGATNAPTTRMILTPAGNVGIGGTAPANALHVYRTGYSPASNDDAALRVEGSWGGGIVMSEGSARMGIYAPGGNQFQVRTGQTASGGGTIGITQDTSGRVGINDTTPQYTLDVAGVVRSTSYFQTNSSNNVHISLNASSGTSRPYIEIDHYNGSTYRRAGYIGYPENNASGAHMQMVTDLGWVNLWAGGYGAGLRVGLPVGQYGTVDTSGSGKGGWEGYAINGNQVFMSNGTEICGIYNDVDNQWLLYFDADTYTRLYDSDGIVAFGANNATTSGGGSGGNGYCGISNECGGFSGTTAVVSTTTVAGVTMKRLGFSSSSYEYKTGIEDFNLSDEAFMSLRPITFHPAGQYVDSTGDVTEIAGGHTIVPDDDEAGETTGLMPLRRAGFGLEDLYGREDTMILASEYSPDPNALIALLTKKLQETMTRVAALEAA
jgi:hypothetical protein